MICVAIHAAGLTVILRRLGNVVLPRDPGFLAGTWFLVRVAWGLIFIHLAQIAVWAMFYYFVRCLPDVETAFYFSIVSYTTVGYGDVVLDKEWRVLAGVEALTGILMCGLSTGFFFAVVTKLRNMLQSAKDADEPSHPENF